MNDTAPVIPDTPIFGHETFTDALAQSIAAGRIAHGWLLTGPSGIGKSIMACMAAAWLLSEKRQSDETFSLDINDPGANLVIRGAHPDFLLVRPQAEDNKSGQIKIDQIRKISGFMATKPGRGGWRVVIVDSMDAVNRNGANALLKLLEEPPERAMLMLVSSRPGQLPPTVRSRCRLVRLSALAEADCRQVLSHILDGEPEPRLEILARLGEGAPGRAAGLAASGSDDMYRALCALIAETRPDETALAELCDKWGRGGAAGQAGREGALWLVGRLFRLAAKHAVSPADTNACEFEVAAIDRLTSTRSAPELATAHTDFLTAAGRMENLYMDFGLFLNRELSGLFRKTLP